MSGALREPIEMLIRAPILATNIPSGVMEVVAERQWEYAWMANSADSPFQGQVRLRLRARIVEGEMGFASLHRSRDRVFHEIVLQAGPGWTEFDIILPPYDDFGGVVARNVGAHGPARAEMRLCGMERGPASLYLIYQQGKVASQTIEAALRRILPGDRVERHHLLSSEGVRKAKEDAAKVLRAARADAVEHYYAGSDGLLAQALAAEKAGPKIQQRMQNEKAWIVTGIREPISQSIAYFFQNISTFCPWLTFREQDLATEVERAMAHYGEVFENARAGTPRDHVALAASTRIMNQPALWFDDEFKRVTNVNIYEAPLGDEGFCTFAAEGANVLLYRFEALPEILPSMLRAMDLCPVEVQNVNVGRAKQSGRLYQEFKARFEPTLAMEQFFLGTRFAERFYPLSWQRASLRTRAAKLRAASEAMPAQKLGGVEGAQPVRECLDQLEQLRHLLSSAQDLEIGLRRRAAGADEDAHGQRQLASALVAEAAELKAKVADLLTDNLKWRELLASDRAALKESQGCADSLQAQLREVRAETEALALAGKECEVLAGAQREALSESRARCDVLERQQLELHLEVDQVKAALQLASDAAAREVSARLVAEAGHEQAMSMVRVVREEALAHAHGESENLLAAHAEALHESRARGELLQNQLLELRGERDMVRVVREEALAHAHDESENLLAAHAEALNESRARGELLQNQLLELCGERDQAKSALQLAGDAASREVSLRLIAEARADQAMNMIEVMRAEAAHVRGESEKSLTAHADTLGESRDRAGRLQGQLEAVHFELVQTRAALEQSCKSNSAAERLAGDALRDQLISLVRVMRAEDLASVREEYDKLLATQVEALAESHSRARTLQGELQEARVGASERQVTAERTGREAAEGLARALEAELVERMRDASALAEALAAARQRLAILEGSRYMRARRMILRLLGR